MKKHSALLSMLFLCGTCLHGEAVAGPVTWAFEGEVTLFVDHNNLLGGEVGVGSPLSGYFTFESQTPSTSPGGGFYRGAIIDLFGAIGDVPFSKLFGENNNYIVVANDINAIDGYVMNAGIELV